MHITFRTALTARIVFAASALAALSACASPPVPTPSIAPPTALAITATVAPSATVARTSTANPTNTTAPTNTPGPTPTPFPTEVTFQSGDLTLQGFLWKPEGAGPFPALLWNHGSEKLPGQLPDNARAFLSKGYVFFLPHRRGQGRSPGPYIQDQLDAAKPADRPQLQLQLLESQLSDQLAGLAFLKSQRFVDTNRLAVAGCSYGGIQTLLGAEAKGTGYRAAVDFAGAAQSWAGSPELQARLKTAVRNAIVPIYFIQAENDFDLAPSRELSTEMQNAGKSYKLKFYPSLGPDHQTNHDFCVTGSATWNDEVFAFLGANLK